MTGRSVSVKPGTKSYKEFENNYESLCAWMSSERREFGIRVVRSVGSEVSDEAWTERRLTTADLVDGFFVFFIYHAAFYF